MAEQRCWPASQTVCLLSKSELLLLLKIPLFPVVVVIVVVMVVVLSKVKLMIGCNC